MNKFASFAFVEKDTGVVRFTVNSGDGSLPEAEAASLLAMHCLVGSKKPVDYFICEIRNQEKFANIFRESERHLREVTGLMGHCIKLSHREQQVFQLIMNDLSNKEIAFKLNLTERTIKFHVSRLLAKFKATNRISLKHVAALKMLPSNKSGGTSRFVVPPEVTVSL